MIHVVLYAKATGHDLRDAGTGPQVGAKPGSVRPLEQHSFDLLQATRRQLRRTPRRPASAQRLRTVVAIRRLPAADTASIHANHSRHFTGAMPLGQQGHRTASASFQFLWAPRWSHATPPTQKDRTLVIQESIASRFKVIQRPNTQLRNRGM